VPEPLVFLQGFLSLVLCTTLVCLASWRSAIFLLGDVEIPELGLGAGVVASGHVCVVSTTLGICGQLNLPCIVTAFALTSLLILHFLPALPRYCFKGEEELKIFAAR